MTEAERQGHRRRSPRLPAYDYRQPGAYAVTICTHSRAPLFGEVEDGEMHLNACGHAALACWQGLRTHFDHAEIDAFVVMPNHVHGIIMIGQTRCAGHDLLSGKTTRPETDASCGIGATEAFGRPVPGSLSTMVRSFKSAATRRINQMRGTPGAPVWQPGYYERVIRNERELNALREYIAENPLKWDLDRENPSNITTAR
jgi:putative transposase